MTNSRTEPVPDPADLPSESQWNGLEDRVGPFVDWRFLASLQQAGCVGRHNGWEPCIQTVRHDGCLQAAAPAWLKSHSHGEFVFDWAWARAAQAAGMDWYPKLLVAAPVTPVAGPRLLGAGHNRAAAAQLVVDLETKVNRDGLSSAAVNFCSEADANVLHDAGWLARFDWQFHWHNPGYRDFDDFLGQLRSKPRKNIRAERRRVAEDGWECRWKDGRTLSADDITLLDHCYQSTFALHGNLPLLNREFFTLCAQRFGADFLACFACREDRALAAAIFWRDQKRLYGRYWGSLVETRDVHFETCYYQGIEYCIRHGLEWFEPGAQGEHKIRRGFLPRKTRSFHYIRHPDLRDAIQRWLVHEAQALDGYREHLDSLNPFGR